ncbi:MAG: capsular polysaccharide biosynthesis protein [Gammaproteobacteria bacterium]
MSQYLMWRVQHLAMFLEPEGRPQWLWQRGKQAPKNMVGIAGIGYKKSSEQARKLCARWQLPYIALEDGFLRSSALGVEGSSPLSLVVDPIGMHYDARRPSLLENMLEQAPQLPQADLETAAELIELMRKTGIGKYNNTPDLADSDPLGLNKELVWVVDQTYGDYAISCGGLTEADFVTMLDRAIEENPGADVRVRIHPDCLAGHKRSCLLQAARERGVALESRALSWASLVKRASRVYVGTSQAGIEALIQGVPVTCFGMSFYAGWGLTDDRQSCGRRHAKLTLEQLVAAAYIRYCRYVDPLTGRRSDALTTARQLARQKQHDSAFAGTTMVIGVGRHKRASVRAFLRSRWGQVVFTQLQEESVQTARADHSRLLVWAGKETESMRQKYERAGITVWRIEDGFLRSVGLGTHGVTARSLIVDKTGIYFDATRPSDLENCLQQGGFDPALLAEAERLRAFIVAKRLTKYNVGSSNAITLGAKPGQRRILVPGQTEDDASLRFGSPSVKSNLMLLQLVREAAPDAWIVYKPHPDVEAGKRPGAIAEQEVLRFADQMTTKNTSIALLYDAVDEVHTITSVSGFEALLYGLRVTTYGMPFYAGWGLTDDRIPMPRRTRKLCLDELIAGCLILYPLYHDAETGLPCDVWHTVYCLTGAQDGRAHLQWTRRRQIEHYLSVLLPSR